jgi:hypothetical protein
LKSLKEKYINNFLLKEEGEKNKNSNSKKGDNEIVVNENEVEKIILYIMAHVTYLFYKTY